MAGPVTPFPPRDSALWTIRQRIQPLTLLETHLLSCERAAVNLCVVVSDLDILPASSTESASGLTLRPLVE